MISESKVRKYCRDDISKIENYEKAIADTTQIWVIHHRLELTLDGEFALSREQLKMHDMYYHRPYYELIFLPPSEHIRLHMRTRTGENHPWYGKHHSLDTLNKMRESKLGDKNAMYGKHMSEETRRKMSLAKKGRTFTEEHLRALREASKRRWGK